jgi:hypothetical protein
MGHPQTAATSVATPADFDEVDIARPVTRIPRAPLVGRL